MLQTKGDFDDKEAFARYLCDDKLGGTCSHVELVSLGRLRIPCGERDILIREVVLTFIR